MDDTSTECPKVSQLKVACAEVDHKSPTAAAAAAVAKALQDAGTTGATGLPDMVLAVIRATAATQGKNLSPASAAVDGDQALDLILGAQVPSNSLQTSTSQATHSDVRHLLQRSTSAQTPSADVSLVTAVVAHGLQPPNSAAELLSGPFQQQQMKLQASEPHLCQETDPRTAVAVELQSCVSPCRGHLAAAADKPTSRIQQRATGFALGQPAAVQSHMLPISATEDVAALTKVTAACKAVDAIEQIMQQHIKELAAIEMMFGNTHTSKLRNSRLWRYVDTHQDLQQQIVLLHACKQQLQRAVQEHEDSRGGGEPGQGFVFKPPSNTLPDDKPTLHSMVYSSHLKGIIPLADYQPSLQSSYNGQFESSCGSCSAPKAHTQEPDRGKGSRCVGGSQHPVKASIHGVAAVGNLDGCSDGHGGLTCINTTGRRHHQVANTTGQAVTCTSSTPSLNGWLSHTVCDKERNKGGQLADWVGCHPAS